MAVLPPPIINSITFVSGDIAANKGKKFRHWRRNGLSEGRRSITSIYKPVIIAYNETDIRIC